MRKFWFIALISACLLLTTNAQVKKNDETVAKIGKEKITAEDFIERFELMPHVGSNPSNVDTTKMEFLVTLIAEKLWGLEAAKQGLDTAEAVKYSYKETEKLYVRDALFKEVIESKVEYRKEDMNKGVNRSRLKIKANALASRDSAEIFSLYSMLVKGASFDSLLRKRPEYKDQDSAAIEISYGQMVDEVEDTLYSLLPGEFAHPLKNQGVWYIFRVNDRTSILSEIKDPNTILSAVKKTLKEKEIMKYYDEYYNKFFVGKTVEANGLLFWTIADKIADILIKKRKSPEYDKVENIYLSVDDLLSIEKQLGPDTLSQELIKLGGKSVTVKDFTRNLMFDGFYSNKFDPKIIAAKLNSRVKTFIEQELLAEEAYRKGLQNLPDVKRETEMWKSNYMGQLLKNKMRDSAKVSDEELYAYYLERQKDKKTSVTQVNILEILTDSLEVVEKALNDIKAGKDFRTLADEHTKRIWTKGKGGEFGFFPVTTYGEIGSTAEKMQIGEIYGPIKLPEGYSIFKLIGRKVDKDSTEKPFAEIKNDLRKEYFSTKFQKFINKKTEELAEKYGVTVNKQALKNVEVVNLNMFTYRYMGFGGRISAVPLPAPLYEWYAPYTQSKKDLP